MDGSPVQARKAWLGTASSSSKRCHAAPPALGLRHGGRALQLQVAAAGDNKGFGGAGTPKPAKVKDGNKRGKPSTRVGQLSRKEMQKRVELTKLVEAGQAPLDPGRAAPGSSSGSSSSSKDGPTVPQVVTDRMLKRILLFTGTPIAAGIILLPAFWYLKVVQHVDFPNWVVYGVQSVAFGGGLLGISYGILSTSWDPAREGSASGITEFRANLPIALARFRRN